MDTDLPFNEDEILKDSHDILRVCSSFVSMITSGEGSVEFEDDSWTDHQSVYSNEADTRLGTEYVRLAHFSVNEYVVSNRPCIGRYSLQPRESHDILANCCLVYLLRFEGQEWRDPDCEVDFPLARCAARFWTKHARLSDELSQQQRNLSLELLTALVKARGVRR